MKKLFKILVPFDFSETANNALNYAKNFVANDSDTEIILVYVNEVEDETAAEKLEAVRAEAHESCASNVSAIVKKGLLQTSLLEVEKAEQVDLIFMGTSLVNNKKLNTNTSSFVLVADCPVIVIPKDYENFKIQKIALVIGEDLIHDSKLLEVLLQVARRFKAKVDVLTVKQGVAEYGYTIVDEKNENAIMYYLENFYSHHHFVDGPDIPTSIFKYAEEKNIDLISILPRNHTKGKTSSEGALTKALSEVSKTPLLVID
ncbi:universal stress protein, UspA family [Formosa agariphila KMM 3901]|uniref:Universal stress protein, UspA family n=1 Tax=Formosa agariphila (strain DSM 15362 / KCTC 12365 / LMG 23005 / KMM 3901 / M-2Alg 35-1) TaxID=1347342 RepID=T2KKN5_FORAG|nr:universal stress protein [Formosa agariphila]CDF78986.1 universal stress protein, UspA family [Formosa agariphila KMM 3901]